MFATFMRGKSVRTLRSCQPVQRENRKGVHVRPEKSKPATRGAATFTHRDRQKKTRPSRQSTSTPPTDHDTRRNSKNTVPQQVNHRFHLDACSGFGAGTPCIQCIVYEVLLLVVRVHVRDRLQESTCKPPNIRRLTTTRSGPIRPKRRQVVDIFQEEGGTRVLGSAVSRSHLPSEAR